MFYWTSSPLGPLPYFPSLKFTIKQSRAMGMADHKLPLCDLLLSLPHWILNLLSRYFHVVRGILVNPKRVQKCTKYTNIRKIHTCLKMWSHESYEQWTLFEITLSALKSLNESLQTPLLPWPLHFQKLLSPPPKRPSLLAMSITPSSFATRKFFTFFLVRV